MPKEPPAAEYHDVNGRPLQKGDVVRPLATAETGRIAKFAVEDGVPFVSVRPIFQSVGPGVWHATDQLVWVAPASKRRS